MVNLEWALMVDGVPADRVYRVLSTEAGVDRAFKKLDRIKPHIVWWEEGTQPVDLLRNREVVMTSAWNGRIYHALKDHKQDLAIVWDGQVWDIEVWVIPKGTANLEEALDFLVFANNPRRMAVEAEHIAYGPARKSAMALVSDRVRKQLPTAKENARRALPIDHEWWATHEGAMKPRFARWREKEPWRYDFHRLDGP